MVNWIIPSDIYTFDGQVLFTTGSNVTTDTLEDLIAHNRNAKYNIYPLLHYETIHRDLVHCISQHPYQGIFSIGNKYSGLLECIKSVFLPEPVLKSLVSLKSSDPYTYRHTLIVFALSSLLASYITTDYDERVIEATSSPSHDIGKICIPVSILQKSEPLTRSELELINHHTVAGYVLLTYYFGDTSNLAAIVARDHHEKRDGTGYPSGIILDNPIVEVVVVCDIYDALISPRPYRPVSFDNRTALEVLTEKADQGEVNIDVVKTLVSLNRKDKPDYRKCILSKEKRGTPPKDNNYGKIDRSEENNEDAGQ